MAKKGLIYFLFFVLVFCTTGCMKVHTVITIDEKGTATVEDTVMVSDEVNEYMDLDLNERASKMKSHDNPNLTARVKKEGGYSGLVVTNSVDDIQKNDIKNTIQFCFASFKTNLQSGKFIEVTKKMFSTEYKMDFNADYVENMNTKDFPPGIETKITIKIPVAAESSNANSVNENDHTYTWDFSKSKFKGRINITYSIANKIAIAAAVILGILFAALAAGLILTFVKKKK